MGIDRTDTPENIDDHSAVTKDDLINFIESEYRRFIFNHPKIIAFREIMNRWKKDKIELLKIGLDGHKNNTLSFYTAYSIEALCDTGKTYLPEKMCIPHKLGGISKDDLALFVSKDTVTINVLFRREFAKGIIKKSPHEWLLRQYNIPDTPVNISELVAYEEHVLELEKKFPELIEPSAQTDPPESEEKQWGINGLAHFFKVSPNTITNWRKRQSPLPVHISGNTVFGYPSELQRWKIDFDEKKKHRRKRK